MAHIHSKSNKELITDVLHVCMCVSVCVHSCMSLSLCVCVCVRACVCVCVCAGTRVQCVQYTSVQIYGHNQIGNHWKQGHYKVNLHEQIVLGKCFLPTPADNQAAGDMTDEWDQREAQPTRVALCCMAGCHGNIACPPMQLFRFP